MTSPRILAGLTHAEYTALPGISASTLRALRQSPLHCRHHLDASDSDTTSRGWLRAIHALVLEPHTWDRAFAVFEGARRAGHGWEAWRAGQMDRTILLASEAASARAVASAVLTHPVAGPMLTGPHGASEVSVTWTDPATGLDCRGRLDRLQRQAGGGWLVADLKTIDSTADHRVRQLVGQHGWHVQLAHYMAAIEAARPADAVAGALVTVESGPPHDVAVWTLGDAELEIARAERAELLALYRRCSESGRWPGRYELAQPLTLPPYCYPDLEDVSDV